MRKHLSILVAAALALPIGLAACDRTVSETSHKTVEPNGTVKEETKTVTQDPNGNTTVHEEKSTDVDSR